MQGWAQVPGTCGELAQGIIGRRFLHITCPINAWVTASATLIPGSGILYGLKERRKAQEAVSRLLNRWGMGQQYDVHITVENPLPIGKGMASSTADICACCFAVSAAIRQELTATEMSEIAISVEPSDGLFYPGIAVFDHRSGSWGKSVGLPPMPNLHILAYDLGGEVNTIEFNRRQDLVEENLKKEEMVRKAFTYILRGLRHGDPKQIGLGATLSSTANQSILLKDSLHELIQGSSALGGVGVNVAHSGTVLGVIIPGSHRHRVERIASWVEHRFPRWQPLGDYLLVGGGPRFISENQCWEGRAI